MRSRELTGLYMIQLQNRWALLNGVNKSLIKSKSDLHMIKPIFIFIISGLLIIAFAFGMG